MVSYKILTAISSEVRISYYPPFDAHFSVSFVKSVVPLPKYIHLSHYSLASLMFQKLSMAVNAIYHTRAHTHSISRHTIEKSDLMKVYLKRMLI